MHDRSRNEIGDKPKNSNYEHDISYNLQMCRWMLKAIGIWPLVYRPTSKLEKIVSVFLFVFCLFGMFFILVPCGHYLIFKEMNTYKKLKLLGPVGFCLSSTIKFFYLGLKCAVFARCIVRLKRNWRRVEDPNHRAIMLRHASMCRNLIGMCIVFIYTGGVLYHAMPFLSKGRHKGNVTTRPLVFPGYDAFFNVQVSPTYEIIYAIHVYCGFVRYAIAAGAYSLTAVFVTHICGQIQIQMVKLNDLVKGKQEKTTDQDTLAIIIEEHVDILRFSKELENALREICLVQIMESTLIICLLEYYILTEWQNYNPIAILTYFVMLISFVFNIFIYCYIGEILTNKCSQIGPASYNIDWYNLPPRKAHNLILLSVVSLYPPKLTAGKMMELSLNTFSNVLQSSAIYFNLLRTVVN